MKRPPKTERRNAIRSFAALLAAILIAAGTVGAFMAYDWLRDLWREQCAITDFASQVRINSGKLVKSDVVAEVFGLRTGANLATIDFAKKRAEALERHPAIRDIHLRRRLPNRVEIAVTERTPVVRMNIRGRKGDTGRVADSEGVVFLCRRGTAMLPTIRESQAPGTMPGKRLSGRTLAALRLVEACRETDFLELGVLDVDASKPDWLLATLGDYSTAKIAWSGMDNPTEGNRGEMLSTLVNLRNAIRSKVGAGAVIWNATNTGFVYSDTKEKIQ